MARPRRRPWTALVARRFRSRAGWVAAATFLIATTASAKDELQGIGRAAVGYTDNVYSSPEEPVPDVPEKTGDVFAVLSPGARLARITPSESQSLTYTFTANLYAQEHEAISFGNRLDYQHFFFLSPYTELLLGASATQEQSYTQRNVPGTVTSVLPLLDDVFSFRLDEAIRHELARDWTFRQSLGLGVGTPLGTQTGSVPFTFEAGGGLGVEKEFRDDAVGPEVRSRYVTATGVFNEDGTQGARSQLINEYMGIWRHDWTRDLTSRLEAGALQIIGLSPQFNYVDPAGRASLTYAREEGRATAYAAHTARADLLLGQVFVIDEAGLRSGIPIDEDDDFWIEASGAYQEGQILTPQGELATEVRIILGEVGAAWRVEDHLEVSLRYSRIEQVSGADLPPLPLSFTRNTVLAGAVFRYPPEREMPRTYRPPVRVDESDAIGGMDAEEAR